MTSLSISSAQKPIPLSYSTYDEFVGTYDSLKQSENLAVANSKFQIYCDEAIMKLLEEGRVEESFRVRKFTSEMVTFSDEHPLYALADKIRRRKNELQETYSMTAFSGFGGSIVKSGHISMDKRILESGGVYYIQFKLNPFAREDLTRRLDHILCSTRCSQLLFQTYLPKTLGEEVDLSLITYVFRKKHEDGFYKAEQGYSIPESTAVEITFKGIGRIVIGNDPEVDCLYNNIDIELDATLDETILLKTLYDMLALFGLGSTVMEHSQEDNQRLKIAKIFRTFCPRQACAFEITKRYYSLEPSQMQAECSAVAPRMRELFQKYLIDSPQLVQERSISPGRLTWSILDLSHELRKQGAIGLYSNIYGNYLSDKIAALCSILREGARSSQQRLLAGKIKRGISTVGDLCRGGGDHVFTRMVTCRDPSIDVESGISILFDLNVLNLGGYAYYRDSYGDKRIGIDGRYYSNRVNLIEFSATVSYKDTFNEVMVKHQISPEFIRGVLVTSNRIKTCVVQYLDAAGLIQNGQIIGKPIDKFVHIRISESSDPETHLNFTEELFAT